MKVPKQAPPVKRSLSRLAEAAKSGGVLPSQSLMETVRDAFPMAYDY